MIEGFSDSAAQLARLGWCKPESSICEEDLEPIDRLFERVEGPGSRMLGDDPQVSSLAAYQQLHAIAEGLVGEKLVPVRAIFFTKAADNNWLVPWHQDVTLAAPNQIERDGYTNWTRKDDIWHVQPPEGVLAEMIALRLHLSDCLEADGPLRVIDKTHCRGRFSPDKVNEEVKQGTARDLLATRGEILAMRPLTLHASSKSTGTSSRRVLHVEYCAASAYPFTTLKEVARTSFGMSTSPNNLSLFCP